MQQITDGWNQITDQVGRDTQLAAYRRQPWRPAISRINLDDPRGVAPPTRDPRGAPCSRRAFGYARRPAVRRRRSAGPSSGRAVVIILCLSIFPLFASLDPVVLASSSSRRGKVDVDFVGFRQLHGPAVRDRADALPGPRPDADAARLGDPDRRPSGSSSGRSSRACAAVRWASAARSSASSGAAVRRSASPGSSPRRCVSDGGRPGPLVVTADSTSSPGSRSTYCLGLGLAMPRGPAAPRPARSSGSSSCCR